MVILKRHYRRDLLQKFPKQQSQTDNDYKNVALTKVKSEIPVMNRDTTIQAIKCIIREINGGNYIDHSHPDLNLLEDYPDFKKNTEIITGNFSTIFFDVDKTRGAIIVLFSLCEHLAKLLQPPVNIENNPTRAQKAQHIREVLLHPTVSGNNLSALSEKDKLISADLNVMFTRNRDGSIRDLSLGNNSYLDHCHIEQNYLRIGTAEFHFNRAAKGYYFNDNQQQLRQALVHELNKRSYSLKAQEKILSCFDRKQGTLDLSNCDLTEIPARQILSMLSPHLQTLYLNDNRITKIEKNAFAGLNSLQLLNLSANNIDKIEKNAFEGLNSLQRLNLSGNDIDKIEKNAFTGLTGLQEMDLSFNDIDKIEKNAFTGLNSLQRLNLYANNIDKIENNAFEGLNSLQGLTLSANDIDKIEKNAFEGLNSLLVLNLSNNKIINIEKKAFEGLTGLCVLNLSHNNRIGGIREDVVDPLLYRIYKNSFLRQTMTITAANSLEIDRGKLVQAYIDNSNGVDVQNLCKEYCLKLLLNNQLQEPEAIKLLANEIYTGVILIKDVYPAKTLDWICRLLNNHNLSILSFLAKNKDSGFKQDECQSVIEHTQPVAPPSSADIRELLKNDLMSQFNLIKESIDQNLLLEVINTFTTDGGIYQHVNNQIKERVTNIISDKKLNLTLTEEQIYDIILQVKSKNVLFRYHQIKNAVDLILPKKLEDRDSVKKTLSNELESINPIAIQTSIVQTNCESLGIAYNAEHYAKLEEFCDLQNALSNYTSKQFKKLAVKTMEDIDKFKDQPEIYSNLISSCSLYLTLNDINRIIKTNPLMLTQACKEKLNVIINYGQIFGVDVDDPIKALFINGKPQQVLLIDKLSHLSPGSTDLKPEMINLITLTVEAPKQTPLNVNNFNEIKNRLPIWLAQSFNKQFTVANTIARTVDKYFNQIIVNDNINLPEEMKHKLTSIFYESSQSLGLSLHISLENKKSIINTLKDQPLVETIEQGFFQEQFIDVVKKCQENYKESNVNFGLRTMSNDELRALPEKLMHALPDQPYFTEKLTKELKVEFKKYKSLTDIKPYEIYYLLGIYFANLSSDHGLGYHVTQPADDNKCFIRFRLYAAICLSQCVISPENNLPEDKKLKMCQEIKQLLFTEECAGQIANKLYGRHSLFNTLNKRVQEILTAKMIV